jgi:hypothetical protein
MKSATSLMTILFASVFVLTACSKQETKTPQPAPQQSASTDQHDHDHDHDDDDHAHHDHGDMIELGTETFGGFTVRATRDEGELVVGGDAAIDIWIMDGNLPRVAAVRFWIGLEDAAGSVKARAHIEDPATPNHFHAHAEIPDPMPEGCKLWVEIELEGRERYVGSFSL